MVGDFEAGRPSHKATSEALFHGAQAAGFIISAEWMPTHALETESGLTDLEDYDGIFSAPGAPYKSTGGALEAIRFARERGWPFLGT